MWKSESLLQFSKNVTDNLNSSYISSLTCKIKLIDSVIPMSTDIFQAIDELLTYNCDPSLPLTHGVGSALCAATSTEYEYRRKNINQRLHLVSICILIKHSEFCKHEGLILNTFMKSFSSFSNQHRLV